MRMSICRHLLHWLLLVTMKSPFSLFAMTFIRYRKVPADCRYSALYIIIHMYILVRHAWTIRRNIIIRGWCKIYIVFIWTNRKIVILTMLILKFALQIWYSVDCEFNTTFSIEGHRQCRGLGDPLWRLLEHITCLLWLQANIQRERELFICPFLSIDYI